MKTGADIGKQLKACRKQVFSNDTQADFAKRIGVSRYTYQKMEQGDPSVAMGHYWQAAKTLGLQQNIEQLFEPPPPSLFAAPANRTNHTNHTNPTNKTA